MVRVEGWAISKKNPAQQKPMKPKLMQVEPWGKHQAGAFYYHYFDF